MAFNLTANLNVALNTGSLRNAVSQVNSSFNNASKLKLGIDRGSFADIGRVKAQVMEVSDSMQQFGYQAGLAAKRFAAFTVTAGSIITLTQTMREAVSAAIDFDREMVRLAQVSNDSSAGVQSVATEITRLSTNFGVSSKDLLNVAITLKQANLSLKDTKIALEAMAQAALAPNFDNLKSTTEGAIAIMNQFNVSAKDLGGALGAVNVVAGEFAVEAGDIIEAVRKTGGAFKAAGGNLNELIALFTAVRQTTRESAETIGTGLRTIFTRIQRNDTAEALKQVGIQLRYTRQEALGLGDANLENQFVGPYEAIRRLAQGLEQLRGTDPRFSAIVEQLGGYRQISKVIPLIKEFGIAQKALGIAQAGQASLALNAAQAQDALAIKLQKLKEQFLEVGRGIVNSPGFRSLVDVFINASGAVLKLIDSLKGMLPLIAALGAIKIGKSLAGLTSGFLKGVSTGEAKKASGGFIRMKKGGVVPGSGSGDIVPALLEPGEVVIPRQKFLRGGRAVVDIQSLPYKRHSSGKSKNISFSKTVFGLNKGRKISALKFEEEALNDLGGSKGKGRTADPNFPVDGILPDNTPLEIRNRISTTSDSVLASKLIGYKESKNPSFFEKIKDGNVKNIGRIGLVYNTGKLKRSEEYKEKLENKTKKFIQEQSKKQTKKFFGGPIQKLAFGGFGKKLKDFVKGNPFTETAGIKIKSKAQDATMAAGAVLTPLLGIVPTLAMASQSDFEPSQALGALAAGTLSTVFGVFRGASLGAKTYDFFANSKNRKDKKAGEKFKELREIVNRRKYNTKGFGYGAFSDKETINSLLYLNERKAPTIGDFKKYFGIRRTKLLINKFPKILSKDGLQNAIDFLMAKRMETMGSRGVLEGQKPTIQSTSAKPIVADESILPIKPVVSPAPPISKNPKIKLSEAKRIAEEYLRNNPNKQSVKFMFAGQRYNLARKQKPVVSPTDEAAKPKYTLSQAREIAAQHLRDNPDKQSVKFRFAGQQYNLARKVSPIVAPPAPTAPMSREERKAQATRELAERTEANRRKKEENRRLYEQQRSARINKNLYTETIFDRFTDRRENLGFNAQTTTGTNPLAARIAESQKYYKTLAETVTKQEEAIPQFSFLNEKSVTKGRKRNQTTYGLMEDRPKKLEEIGTYGLAKETASATSTIKTEIEKLKQIKKKTGNPYKPQTGSTQLELFAQQVAEAQKPKVSPKIAAQREELLARRKKATPTTTDAEAEKRRKAAEIAIKNQMSLGLDIRSIQKERFGFASGGIVPGVGNSDTVPMNLPEGSFVIRKSSVNKIGADRLAKMGRYASGGSVPSLLTPGEYVFSPKEASRIGSSKLHSMNKFAKFAEGGNVSKILSSADFNSPEQMKKIFKQLIRQIINENPTISRGDAISKAKSVMVDIKAQADKVGAAATQTQNLQKAYSSAEKGLQQAQNAFQVSSDRLNSLNASLNSLQQQSARLANVQSTVASQTAANNAKLTVENTKLIAAKAKEAAATTPAQRTKAAADIAKIESEILRLNQQNAQNLRTSVAASKQQAALAPQITQAQADVRQQQADVNARQQTVTSRTARRDTAKKAFEQGIENVAKAQSAFQYDTDETGNVTRKGRIVGTKKPMRGPGTFDFQTKEEIGNIQGTFGIRGNAAKGLAKQKIANQYQTAVYEQLKSRAEQLGKQLDEAELQAAAQDYTEQFQKGRRKAIIKDGKVVGDVGIGKKLTAGGSKFFGYKETGEAKIGTELVSRAKGLISQYGGAGAAVGANFLASNIRTGAPTAESVVRAGVGGTVEVDRAKAEEANSSLAFANSIEKAANYATVAGQALSVLGPVGRVAGTALGGLIGAINGYTNGAQEAENQIKEVKLGVALENLQGIFERVGNGLQDFNDATAKSIIENQRIVAEGNASKAFEVAGGNKTGLDRLISGITLQGFGGLDVNKLNVESRRLNQQSLASQIVPLTNVLNKYSEQIGKQAVTDVRVAGGDVGGLNFEDFRKNLTQSLKDGIGGFGKEQILQIAAAKNITFEQASKEFEKIIQESFNAEKLKQISLKAVAANEKTITSMQGLSNAVNAAAFASDKFSSKLETNADLFEGKIGSLKIPNLADQFSSGTPDLNAFNSAITEVSNSLGVFGKQFREQGNAINVAAQTLPDILAGAVANPIAGQDVSTQISDGLREALKQRGLTGGAAQAVVSSVAGAASGQDYEKLLAEAGGDVGKLSQKLLSGISEPLQQAFKDIATKQNDAANQYIQGLTELANRQRQVIDSYSKLDTLQLQSQKFRARETARAVGMPSQAEEFTSYAQLTQGFRNRQQRLTGFGAGAAENPQAIANRLGLTQQAVVGQEEKVKTMPKEGAAFRLAAQELTKLKSEASNLQEALKNLADQSDKVSAAESKLEKIRSEQETARSFGRKLLTSGAEEQQKLAQGQQLLNIAQAQGGNVGNFSVEMNQILFDFLDNFGPAGKDMADQIVERTTGLGTGRKKEEQMLVAELANIYATQEQAQLLLIKNQENLQKDYFSNLDARNQKFYSELEKFTNELLKSQALAERGREQQKLARIQDVQKNAGFLGQAKISTKEDFAAVTQNRGTILELAQRKKERERLVGLSAKTTTNVLGDVAGVSGNRGVVERQLIRDLGLSGKEAADVVDEFISNISKGLGDKSLQKALETFQQNSLKAVDKDIGSLSKKLGDNELGKKMQDLSKNLAAGDINEDQFIRAIDSLKELNIGVGQDLTDAAANATSKIDELTGSINNLGGIQQVLPQQNIGAMALATGGSVFTPRGSDTVPAMLTPGEFVVNRKSAQQNLSLLKSINGGTNYLANGGMVGYYQAGREVKDPKLVAPVNIQKEEDPFALFKSQNKDIFDSITASVNSVEQSVSNQNISNILGSSSNFLDKLLLTKYSNEVLGLQGSLKSRKQFLITNLGRGLINPNAKFNSSFGLIYPSLFAKEKYSRDSYAYQSNLISDVLLKNNIKKDIQRKTLIGGIGRYRKNYNPLNYKFNEELFNSDLMSSSYKSNQLPLISIYDKYLNSISPSSEFNKKYFAFYQNELIKNSGIKNAASAVMANEGAQNVIDMFGFGGVLGTPNAVAAQDEKRKKQEELQQQVNDLKKLNDINFRSGKLQTSNQIENQKDKIKNTIFDSYFGTGAIQEDIGAGKIEKFANDALKKQDQYFFQRSGSSESLAKIFLQREMQAQYILGKLRFLQDTPNLPKDQNELKTLLDQNQQTFLNLGTQELNSLVSGNKTNILKDTLTKFSILPAQKQIISSFISLKSFQDASISSGKGLTDLIDKYGNALMKDPKVLTDQLIKDKANNVDISGDPEFILADAQGKFNFLRLLDTKLKERGMFLSRQNILKNKDKKPLDILAEKEQAKSIAIRQGILDESGINDNTGFVTFTGFGEQPLDFSETLFQSTLPEDFVQQVKSIGSPSDPSTIESYIKNNAIDAIAESFGKPLNSRMGAYDLISFINPNGQKGISRFSSLVYPSSSDFAINDEYGLKSGGTFAFESNFNQETKKYDRRAKVALVENDITNSILLSITKYLRSIKSQAANVAVNEQNQLREGKKPSDVANEKSVTFTDPTQRGIIGSLLPNLETDYNSAKRSIFLNSAIKSLISYPNFGNNPANQDNFKNGNFWFFDNLNQRGNISWNDSNISSELLFNDISPTDPRLKDPALYNNIVPWISFNDAPKNGLSNIRLAESDLTKTVLGKYTLLASRINSYMKFRKDASFEPVDIQEREMLLIDIQSIQKSLINAKNLNDQFYNAYDAEKNTIYQQGLINRNFFEEQNSLFNPNARFNVPVPAIIEGQSDLETQKLLDEIKNRNNAEGMFRGGLVNYLSGGGVPSHRPNPNPSLFKPKGTDTVPAMLTPGEFVVRKSAAQANLPLLHAINSGNYLANGGMPISGGLLAQYMKRDIGIRGTDRPGLSEQLSAAAAGIANIGKAGVISQDVMKEIENQQNELKPMTRAPMFFGSNVGNGGQGGGGFGGGGGGMGGGLEQLVKNISPEDTAVIANYGKEKIDELYALYGASELSLPPNLTSLVDWAKQLGYLANGGSISGTDTIPAMLTPGEFVVNKNAVSRFGLSNLNKINGYANGGLVGYYQNGGFTGNAGGMAAYRASNFNIEDFTSGVDKFSTASSQFAIDINKFNVSLASNISGMNSVFSDFNEQMSSNISALAEVVNTIPSSINGNITLDGNVGFSVQQDLQSAVNDIIASFKAEIDRQINVLKNNM